MWMFDLQNSEMHAEMFCDIFAVGERYKSQKMLDLKHR